MKYLIILNILFFHLIDAVAAEKEVLNGLYDKNEDGIQDVAYSYFNDNSYIELNDSNYDTKIDSRCLYDSNDTLTDCAYDQDFDGYYETFVTYEIGVAVKEVVDSNADKYFDIALYYKEGVLFEGFKYYSKTNEENSIGYVLFEFGYPLAEQRTKAEVSALEFSDKHKIKELNLKIMQ